MVNDQSMTNRGVSIIKKNKLFSFFLFMILACGRFVYAGMPGPLCPTVTDSPDIVEVAVDTAVGQYPPSLAQKNWAPSAEELKKISKTAKVVQVHKGNKKVGDLLQNENLISSSLGNSGKFWTAFFSHKQVVILTGLSLDGWVADGGDEGIPAEPFDYLPGYGTFKQAVLNCLSSKNP